MPIFRRTSKKSRSSCRWRALARHPNLYCRLNRPMCWPLALKPTDDGNAWIVRLFGASGEERKAKLRWSAPKALQVWLSALSEKPLKVLDGEITVAGWDLV